MLRSSHEGYSDVTEGNNFYYCPLPHAVFIYDYRIEKLSNRTGNVDEQQ